MLSIIKKIIYKFITPNTVHTIKMAMLKIFSLKVSVDSVYEIQSLGKKNTDVFFGYYDISPFSPKGDKIVYLALNKENNAADIVIQDLNTNSEHIISNTSAWNWQQGCRVRWLPNKEESIIFNDVKDTQYVSKIINLTNNECKFLNWPLYDIDRFGQYGLTIDFSRLGKYRPGYGYTNFDYIEPLTLLSEGISIVDIENNTIDKILTYEEIFNKLSDPNINIENCYINHLSYSPSSKKFLFFWIQIIKGVHKASLFVYDMLEEKLVLLENTLSVSHYDWIDDQSIIVTAYNDSRDCKYFIYNLNGDRKAFLPELLIQDGHPTWINENLVVSDTYPDKYGYQKIISIRQVDKKIETLLEIYSSYKIHGEKRCDLHPRVDNENKIICFDSNTHGKRNIKLMRGCNMDEC